MADFDKPLEKTNRTRLRFRRRRDNDAFGRFAEATARFMGSPKFLLYMTLFVIAWITANLLLAHITKNKAWDPYPFILLNLAFSTQASYSAPLILLAQNRQDDRDRVLAEQDRQRAERNLSDTEYLMREIASLRIAIRDLATRDYIRSEVKTIIETLRNQNEQIIHKDETIRLLKEEIKHLKEN